MRYARPRKPTLQDYNRRVLRYLEQLSPDHARLLNAEGGRLGWWDAVAYHFSRGVDVPGAARSLADKPDPYANNTGGAGCDGPEGQNLSCFI